LSTESRGYPIPAVCCVVYDPRDDMLLLIRNRPHKHEGDAWCFLGGKQECGETSSEAAWRELCEEGGEGLNRYALCRKGIVGFVEDFESANGKQYLTIVHLFVTCRKRIVVKNAEPENHSDIAWFSAHDLPTPVTRGFRRVMSLMRGNTEFIGPNHLVLADADWKP
jgi:8-oxo-dGTP pyrophosphatase MutT (NUDIX family)